jgi:hypothetical protein
MNKANLVIYEGLIISDVIDSFSQTAKDMVDYGPSISPPFSPISISLTPTKFCNTENSKLRVNSNNRLSGFIEKDGAGGGSVSDRVEWPSRPCGNSCSDLSEVSGYLHGGFTYTCRHHRLPSLPRRMRNLRWNRDDRSVFRCEHDSDGS